jgi:hypothetical protein
MQQGMDVCLYSIFVLSYVDGCLTTGWSPVQGVKDLESEVKRSFSRMSFAPGGSSKDEDT